MKRLVTTLRTFACQFVKRYDSLGHLKGSNLALLALALWAADTLTIAVGVQEPNSQESKNGNS